MIIYRHPQTSAPQGLCYGRTDFALADCAAEQIREACAGLRPCARIISSPARRALALAEPLAAKAGLSVERDARLAEINFGEWEGRFWSEIDRRESDPWAENPWERAPPGGESFGEIYARTASLINDAGEGACLISHAGVIRAALMIRRGLS